METVRTKPDFPVTSRPWFERVGVTGFAGGGAALGFAISLFLVWNSAPGAASPPALLLSAQPRRGTEAPGGQQAVGFPVPANRAVGQVELESQPLVSPSRPAIDHDENVQATNGSATLSPQGQTEKVARQEPPDVPVTIPYQASQLMNRDPARGAIGTGPGPAHEVTGSSIAVAIPTPRTEYRRSATTHYRTSARNKYRAVDRGSGYVDQTAPASGTAFGTTATGIPTYVGPRGGIYHYSASGNKVYQRKR